MSEALRILTGSLIAAVIAACGGCSESSEPVQETGLQTQYERSTDRAIGSPDAPLTLVEYFSVACSHCLAFHENVFPMIRDDYVETGQVRFVYREMLRGSAPIAMSGFMLTRCVDDADYFTMIDLLFQQQTAIFDAAQEPGGIRRELLGVARNAGLSEREFDACISSEEHRNSVMQSHEMSIADGFSGTPAFLVNGQRLEARRDGVQSFFYWGDERILIDGEPVQARMDAATFRILIDYMLARTTRANAPLTQQGESNE